MNLARFPRRRYADGPTPLQPLERLTKTLGGASLFVKRDDLLGFAAGGNKIRKLEFVVADALAKGADFLITCGAVQSNHCRLTLAAAVREGLRCGLVLEERVAGSYRPHASGNNFLYRLMGVDRIRVAHGGADMPGAMNAMAAEVSSEGGRPYVIPGGASNPLGALGYVACAQEILSQAFAAGIRIDRVVCASGSAGTHAGLLCGLWGANSGIPVVGMNVSRTKPAQEELVYRLARETAVLLGIRADLPRGEVVCFDDYVGPGYSLPTPGMVEAVKLLARTEALLLDPVYTGKAMAGLIDQVRKGLFSPGENVLFVHTGGSPALYAYLDSFWEE
jgi:D-cysteine desulfhydrase